MSILTLLGFDSLNQVELITYVEGKFDVRFGDHEAINLKNPYELILLTYQYYSEKRNVGQIQVIEKNDGQKEVANFAKYERRKVIRS